ncbi:hypothetical protein [Paracoccus sp. (in: a-proteobacteria)]|uniref:hypothetical protein n=1 Tax=Paracoccus sp. TaxID=267 RepID=UPI002898C0E4|nr:hypothetical protein [Paracoccus sp. (in: a-proteobacteria)]
MSSALVAGFAAAVLHEMARLRLVYCASSGGAQIPANLNEFRHLIPGLSMTGHLTGTLIFVPVMALALFAKGRQLWLSVALAIGWIAAVLVHLGLQIPTTCPQIPQPPEALSFYVWPAMLGAMVLFRINASRAHRAGKGGQPAGAARS